MAELLPTPFIFAIAAVLVPAVLVAPVHLAVLTRVQITFSTAPDRRLFARARPAGDDRSLLVSR